MYAAKTTIRGRFITINAYVKKEERFQMNDLTFHFKILEIELQRAESRK